MLTELPDIEGTKPVLGTTQTFRSENPESTWAGTARAVSAWQARRRGFLSLFVRGGE